MPYQDPRKILRVLVFDNFTQKVDRSDQAIQTLHKYYREKQSKKDGLVIDDEIIVFDNYKKLMYLQTLNRDSVAINHRIKLSKDMDCTKHVGILPVPLGDAPVRNEIVTEGFKYNFGKIYDL